MSLSEWRLKTAGGNNYSRLAVKRKFNLKISRLRLLKVKAEGNNAAKNQTAQDNFE